MVVPPSEQIKSGVLVPQERWLRIIPIALLMYTVSFINRTNISPEV